MPTYKNKSADELADLYKRNRLVHQDPNFWRAFIQSSPGASGIVFASHQLRVMGEPIEPTVYEESDKLLINLDVSRQIDEDKIAREIQSEFPQLNWDTPNKLKPVLGVEESYEKGVLKKFTIVGNDITKGTDIANSLVRWFRINEKTWEFRK